MNTWRITTNLVDNTARASESNPIVGATVIHSPKGVNKFFKFYRGDTQGIINTFGYPSKDYPSIQDALDMVSASDLFVASAYKSGLYGGVFVTPTDTVSFTKGVSVKEFDNLSEVDNEVIIDKADSVNVEFSKIIPNVKYYNSESMSIYVNGTELSATVETSDDTETYTATEATATFNTSTGVFTITFVTAPTEGDIVIKYTTDMSDTLFVLFDRDMQEDDLQVKVVTNKDIENAFDIHVQRYDTVEGNYLDVNNSPFTVGLKDTDKDNYGSNIYIENIFNDNQTMFTPLVINSDFDDFVSNTNYVKLGGGNRGAEVSGSDFAQIYQDLQDVDTYNVQYVVDPLSKDEVISVFESLRNNYQKYTRFLYCSPNLSADAILADPTLASRGITNNRGMYCYVLSWGIHQDVYNGNPFMCSNMGLIATKLVGVLQRGWGVPAFIDSNGVGGLLGSSITKLAYGANPSQLEQFSELCLNPIINDKTYGVMIEGWRTRQLALNVYSGIGQSSLADTLINNIVSNILPFCIGKLIDDTIYSYVRTNIESLLNNYSEPLEDFFVLCSDENNTSDTKNAQKLMVSVGVVFKGYAERVIFNFVSYRNGTNVEEELTK